MSTETIKEKLHKPTKSILKVPSEPPGQTASHDQSQTSSQAQTIASKLPSKAAAVKCRGILEWTIRDAVVSDLPPRWAGPCLFEVDNDSAGRRTLRGRLLDSPEGEELAIPLLAVTAVREEREEAADGHTFCIKHKASNGERIELRLRAQTRAARKTWVRDLCELVGETRGSSRHGSLRASVNSDSLSATSVPEGLMMF